MKIPGERRLHFSMDSLSLRAVPRGCPFDFFRNAIGKKVVIVKIEGKKKTGLFKYHGSNKYV